jgi:hypothetical protein
MVTDGEYEYLRKYAQTLQEEGVKWTPVLEIASYPPWLENDYMNDWQPAGHGMPFSYNSKAWDHAGEWVLGFIRNLKDYIGDNNVIEEIFISNEMMFHYELNTDRNRGEEVKELLITPRNFVLEALIENDVNVPVGWKLADITANNENDPDKEKRENSIIYREKCGLTDEILKELFLYEGKDSEGNKVLPYYTKPNLIGLNLYESPKGQCQNITTRKDDYKELGFNGKIYYTEYNSLSQDYNNQGLFSKNELKRCILESYQNEGVYWTYFKWNGGVADPPHEGGIQQEQRDGLHETFEDILYTFSDVLLDEWYAPYTTTLYKKGIISGDDSIFSPTTYRPADNMLKCEFLKLALESAYEDKNFETAVPWYKNYVEFAENEGIISSDFNPTEQINRAEAVKILIRAYGIKLKDTSKLPDTLRFSDHDDITADYIPYIYTGQDSEHRILEGYPEGTGCDEKEAQDSEAKYFCPNKLINRAEAAKIVCVAKYGEETCVPKSSAGQN